MILHSFKYIEVCVRKAAGFYLRLDVGLQDYLVKLRVPSTPILLIHMQDIRTKIVFAQ